MFSGSALCAAHDEGIQSAILAQLRIVGKRSSPLLYLYRLAGSGATRTCYWQWYRTYVMVVAREGLFEYAISHHYPLASSMPFSPPKHTFLFPYTQ